MNIAQIMLLATTVVVWTFSLVYPLKAVRYSMKYAGFLMRHPVAVVLNFILATGIWWMWFAVFGFWTTVVLCIVGGLLGAARGMTIQRDMDREMELVCSEID